MASSKEIGNASAGHRSRHKKRRTVVPIFIVPGILGSRLSVRTTTPSGKPGGRLVWNPAGQGADTFYSSITNFFHGLAGLDDPGPIVCDETVMQNPNARVEPDDWNRYPVGHKYHLLGERIPGFYEAVVSFYGELVRTLDEDLVRASRARKGTVHFRIFVVGYDWRQSNEVSARRLFDKIQGYRQQLEEENFKVKKHIIIAHSMGGFVSRHCCRIPGHKTAILYLIASPSYGAPEAYVYLRRGVATAVGTKFTDLFLKGLLVGVTSSRKKARQVLRSYSSVHELLPNDAYGDHGDPSWLDFPEHGTGYPLAGIAKRDPGAAFNDCRVIRNLDREHAKRTGQSPVQMGIIGLYYMDPFTGGFNVDQDLHARNRRACLANQQLTPIVGSKRRVFVPKLTRIWYGTNGQAVSKVRITYNGVNERAGRVEVLLHNDDIAGFTEGPGDGSVTEESGKCRAVANKKAVKSRRVVQGDHGKYANIVANKVLIQIAKDTRKVR